MEGGKEGRNKEGREGGREGGRKGGRKRGRGREEGAGNGSEGGRDKEEGTTEIYDTRSIMCTEHNVRRKREKKLKDMKERGSIIFIYHRVGRLYK